LCVCAAVAAATGVAQSDLTVDGDVVSISLQGLNTAAPGGPAFENLLQGGDVQVQRTDIASGPGDVDFQFVGFAPGGAPVEAGWFETDNPGGIGTVMTFILRTQDASDLVPSNAATPTGGNTNDIQRYYIGLGMGDGEGVDVMPAVNPRLMQISPFIERASGTPLFDGGDPPFVLPGDGLDWNGLIDDSTVLGSQALLLVQGQSSADASPGDGWHTFSLTLNVTPTPSSAALLGVFGLAASRRRR
ncbi:MAG: hypothetical protein AAF747_10710, partial [Planctomycetota bacterium]